MGAFVSYLLQVGLVMALLFVSYKVLLSSATFHAFKRVTLLGVLVASWVLPLAWPADEPVAGREVEDSLAMLDSDRAGTVAVGVPAFVNVDGCQDTAVRRFWGWLAPVYVCGFVVVLAFTLWSVVRLALMIRGGDKRRWPGFTVVLNDRAAGPFSWGKYVVMRRQDCDRDFSLVMAHELSHLRRYHWIDTMLAQLNVMLMWFNPVSYMIMRELKYIHEFEADMSIAPGQARRYQLMLIKKTVGSSFPTFANSLNHSQIKIRITMMMKRKSSSARRLAALALPGAAALALLTLSQPSVAQILADISASSFESVSGRKISQNSVDGQIATAVDAMNAPIEKAKQVERQESKTILLLGEELVEEITADDRSRTETGAAIEGKENPAYFVDGKLFTGVLNDLNPSDIKSMTVVKDDPEYPQGKIMIVLKGKEDKVAVAAEKVAGFKGGTDALLAFLAENIVCPEGITQTVRSVILFTVGTDGALSDFKVLRSGGDAADAEAIRVLSKTSHKWESATRDGVPVVSRFAIPVMFSPK